MCHLMDLCPTILDLAGAPRPASVESSSLAGAVRKPGTPLRSQIVFGYRNVQRGIRTDRWKLIAYNVGGKKTLQLFDLQSDPLEIRNLSEESAQQARVRELWSAMKQQLRAAGDRQDLEAADWTAYRGA